MNSEPYAWNEIDPIPVASAVPEIPEAAVEAAARAWYMATWYNTEPTEPDWSAVDSLARAGWLQAARAALAAAAPEIARAAKVEALRDAASRKDARLGGHSGVSVRWLQKRADELEARS